MHYRLSDAIPLHENFSRTDSVLNFHVISLGQMPSLAYLLNDFWLPDCLFRSWFFIALGICLNDFLSARLHFINKEQVGLDRAIGRLPGLHVMTCFRALSKYHVTRYRSSLTSISLYTS